MSRRFACTSHMTVIWPADTASQKKGEYHGAGAMSYEVGKKALDFLIANSGKRRNLEVDFFGGEPLMNWQVVKDLVAYGREQEKSTISISVLQ